MKIASMCENNIVFDLHELVKNEKGAYVAKNKNVIYKGNGEIDKVYPIPAIKQVTVFGKHPKYKMTGIMMPYALTDIDEKTWDHIKVEYAHAPEIRNGMIFAEKDDIKTELAARDEEKQAIESGTKKRSEKTLINKNMNKDIGSVQIARA